jgi:hypothetical protein
MQVKLAMKTNQPARRVIKNYNGYIKRYRLNRITTALDQHLCKIDTEAIKNDTWIKQ